MEKTNLNNPVITEKEYEDHVFGMKRDKFLSDLDALDTMLSNWVIGESNDKVFTLLLGRKISEIKTNCIIKPTQFQKSVSENKSKLEMENK